MILDPVESDRPRLATRVVAAIAAAKLVTHFATNVVTPYGIHRDEFLYIAMGSHLQFWRMDFPPLIAMLANVERAILGDSVFAIRFFPALAGAMLVVLAALIARELGGGRFAQVLAAVSVFANPLFLRAAALFQPVVFDQLWWTLALLALATLCRTRDPRWWLGVGAACGFGLFTKFSILLLGAAIVVATLLTSLRRDLTTRWPWLGFLAAMVIGSPSVVGQVRLGFPVLTYTSELRESQLSHVSIGGFIGEQILWNPVAAILALAGLLALLRADRLVRFRALGWTCLVTFLLVLGMRGKPYYIGPIYPTLFAAGSVVLAGLNVRRIAPMLRWATPIAIVVYALVGLPIGLPILPPAKMARYATALGVTPALRTNRGTIGQLPQDYADMLGWPEQVAAIARVYHGLPAAERQRAVIFAANYGEAGAIDFYGPRHGLPGAVSDAGTYWFFGPGENPGEVLITINVDESDLREIFASVTAVSDITHPWAVEEERDVTIRVSRKPRMTLQQIWPGLRE
ncbi:MAG: ArnT family glycosyltransferase [Gemmatimonadaceae bacterium]